MQAQLTTKPVQQVIAAIQALDLESVKVRVMDSELGEGWTREYADSIEVAYKNYLTMLTKYQDDAEDILLSNDVDEFWHTHILQTIKYAEDCQNMFGNFLHHEPHIGERTSADIQRRSVLAEKTQRLYQLEFGGAESAAWAGVLPRAESAAWSGASLNARNSAWPGTAINAKSAAWSGVAIKSEHAAWSGVAVKTANAAWSGVAIRGDNAAWSGAAGPVSSKLSPAAYSVVSANT